MKVVLARIDSRLVHGQVIEAWVPHTGANLLMVANDRAYEGDLQRMVMESVASPRLAISVIPVRDCASQQSARRMDEERGIFLFADPRDVWRAMDLGFVVDSLNVGVMHYQEGRIKLLPSVFVGKDDIDYFRKIGERGVEIELRPLPCDRPLPLWDVLGFRAA